MSPSLDPEALLQHAPWMRRLARSLVRDRERADELTQETWLRVLQSPPDAGRSARGWIATVMRNLWRSEVRGRVRREAREREGAPAAESLLPPDLVERAALQRELVDAVLQLDEPYRRTILLRYFEERTPTAIARLEKVPLATVKTRLARGLTRLREALARTEGPGGRGSLMGCLIAAEFARSPVTYLPWILGVLTVKSKLLVAGALVAAAFVLWSRNDPTTVAEDAPIRPGAEAPAVSSTTGPGAPPVSEPRRAALPGARTRVEGTPPRNAGRRFVEGRVVDDLGRPVPGVNVVRSQGSSSVVVARTDERGAFQADPDQGQGPLLVDDPRWATVLAGTPVSRSPEAEDAPGTVLVVAPAIDLSGVVVDEFAVPVSGARVTIDIPASLRSRLELVLDYSVESHASVLCEDTGVFTLARAPALEGASLIASAEGKGRWEGESPLSSRADLVLVLTAPGSTSGELVGIVLDPGEQPVAGALVSYGIDSRRTDADGRFAFPRNDPESWSSRMARHVTPDMTRLCAVHPGFLPGVLRADVRPDGSTAWPDRIVLSLGPPPLALAGHVVDSGGTPVPGATVWISNPTFFGGVPEPERLGRRPALTHVENLLASAPPGWNGITTDAEGHFTIEGLLDREYTLEVMDPSTLLRCVVEHQRPGPRLVTLELAGALYETLSGKIVDRRGTPLADLSVAPMCDAFVTRIEGQVASTHHSQATAVVTDADGIFTLERVPRDLVYLRIDGADTIPLEWGRGVAGGLASLVGGEPEDLVIEVGRRCHFQVELALAEEADAVGVLDGRGEPLTLSEFQGNSRMDGPQLALLEGRSSNLAVSDAAAFLVLYRDGVEVRRVPVRLVPGTPTMLRP